MLMQKTQPAPADSKEFQDLGFGTKIPTRQARLLNRDGTFNVERRGLPPHFAVNAYHNLINLSWPKFILIVILSYVTVNCLFDLVYLAIGTEHLVGQDGRNLMSKFWEAFFFSAQTLTTVGYGRISPEGFAASMVAAFESLAGLMGFALATGLLYARFSRPQARMLFSEHALIAPYRGGTALMFRVANARKNQLIETEALVSVSMVDAAGTRRFQELPLERKNITFFPLSWTIVHPIGPDSPLWGFGAQDFRALDGEFFIQMKSFDDVFSQTVYARNSYRFSEVVFGAKFTFIFGRNDAGATTIDLHRLDEHTPADLEVTPALPEVASALPKNGEMA